MSIFRVVLVKLGMSASTCAATAIAIKGGLTCKDHCGRGVKGRRCVRPTSEPFGHHGVLDQGSHMYGRAIVIVKICVGGHQVKHL